MEALTENQLNELAVCLSSLGIIFGTGLVSGFFIATVSISIFAMLTGNSHDLPD